MDPGLGEGGSDGAQLRAEDLTWRKQDQQP